MLRQHSLRLALAVALGAAAGQAYAFGLGSIKIQSYIGQPLRAEIGITQITPDEAASLKVGVASPSAFQAARLQYSDVLGGVKISLQRHGDGTPYLLVTSDRPVREPYLDLLIRAQWSSGELSRDYTVLLDPPNMAAPSAPQPQIAAQAPEQPAAPAPAPAPLAPPLPRETKPVRPAPAPAAPPPSAQSTGGTYVVKPGDTLSKVAREMAVPTVSLDQMLTALYRENSGAFINQNMNLLKAGAVLRMPSAEQAASVSPAEARRFVVAQSRSFNAYRERLAGVVAQTKPAAGGGSQRESGGQVQAKVEEPAAAAPAPQSTLKLSKAEVKGGGTAQQIADQKQAAADQAKIAQLQKNIDALKAAAKEAEAAAKPAAAGAAATVAAAASKAAAAVTLPAAAPGEQSPAKPASAAPAKPASAAASAPAKAGASAAVAAASHPAGAASHAAAAGAGASAPHAASAPPAVHKPAPAPQPEPSLFSTLLASPLLLPVGGGIIILLLLLALLLQRRKKAKSQRDVSVFDSRMSVADSFFGGTGGERVDTRNSSVGSTFSSSQIDTNDVDPVAEADVYLAYGRDLQAEEILKEAIKANPDRNAARLKLLEIYAKRKDSRSFEVGAAELFALTQGVGEDWQKAQELGRGLDPVNPLYHNTVPPSTLGVPSTVPQTEFPAATPTGLAALVPPTLPSTEMMSNVQGAQAKTALPESLDLDLNLPLSSEEPVTASPTTQTPAEPAASAVAAAPRAEPAKAAEPPAVPPLPELPKTAAAPAPEHPPMAESDFLSSGLDFTVPSRFGDSRQPEAGATKPAAAAPAAASPDAPLEFDLSSIPLDAGPAMSKPAPAAARELEHAPGESRFADSQPLDIRFELAAESLAIGDTEAARNLLEELKAEGDETVRARAQEMLDKIGR